jgi:hypothetical protein
MSNFLTWDQLKAQGFAFYDEIKAARADGKISFKEVFSLVSNLTVALMQVAETFEGATGAQKKEWVLKTAYEAYQADFDINIPYVPDFLEGPLEKAIFEFHLPALIEIVINAVKGLFHINKKKEV